MPFDKKLFTPAGPVLIGTDPVNSNPLSTESGLGSLVTMPWFFRGAMNATDFVLAMRDPALRESLLGPQVEKEFVLPVFKDGDPKSPLRLKRGACVVVIAPGGSGKSTLARRLIKSAGYHYWTIGEPDASERGQDGRFGLPFGEGFATVLDDLAKQDVPVIADSVKAYIAETRFGMFKEGLSNAIFEVASHLSALCQRQGKLLVLMLNPLTVNVEVVRALEERMRGYASVAIGLQGFKGDALKLNVSVRSAGSREWTDYWVPGDKSAGIQESNGRRSGFTPFVRLKAKRSPLPKRR